MSTQRLSIYELNTVTWLGALSQRHGRNITLADVPAEEWDRLRGYGCNAVWFMGVWERSPAAVAINKADRDFVRYLKRTVPRFDFDQDVVGSAYSIREYVVSEGIGGPEALAVARAELKKRGLMLILDYVPNHVAPDHAWATEHPEYFIQGTPAGVNVLAQGQDPTLNPWSDVLQLNAFSKELRKATANTIKSIAAQCDGVRCDMAMLLLNQVFLYAWQARAGQLPKAEFWTEVIKAVHAKFPSMLFIAEAYWRTAEQLFAVGFDYCYDKDTFYDSVHKDDTWNLSYMLFQPADYQRRMVRFLENHDEPRAAHVFSLHKHKAAAVLLATTPGSRMYYEGQFDGLQVRTPVHVRRDPSREPTPAIQAFYARLLPIARSIENDFTGWSACHAVTLGGHHLREVMAWTWHSANGAHYLVVVNWSDRKRQARVLLPWSAADAPAKITRLLSTRTTTDMRYVNCSLECSLAPFEAVILEAN